MSPYGNSALPYPTTPPTSLISVDDNDEVLTPIMGNPTQLVPYTPNHRPHLLQLSLQITPIRYTPESPIPENRGPSNIFRQHDLPENHRHQLYLLPPPPPPNISPVADGLQNPALHPHPAFNEWVTWCLVCGKTYKQGIDKTVAQNLNQTAQPGETVRERQMKKNAFLDGIQSGVSTFLPPGVSQAAACDGLIYFAKYNGQNPGMQGYDTHCP